MKAVWLEWVDSASSSSWAHADDMAVSVIHSVGWLVRETDDFVVITTSIDLDQHPGQINRAPHIDPLAIPKVAITEMHMLEWQ